MASNATARVCEPKKSPVTAPYNVERYGGEERDIAAFIISADVHRRHLKPKQRREIVADFLKADPTATDRAIAEKAKVDKNTVAKVRREKETRGEIHHVGKRTDTKGRQQPAEKPRKLVPPSKPTLAVALRPQLEPAPLVEQKPLSGDAWWDQEPQTIADVMVEHMTRQKLTKVLALAMDGLKTKDAVLNLVAEQDDINAGAAQ